MQHNLVTRVSLHDGLNDGNLRCVYESCVSVYEADELCECISTGLMCSAELVLSDMFVVAVKAVHWNTPLLQ